MPGSLKYLTPARSDGRKISDSLCRSVRRVAKRRDVKVPKNITLMGCANFDFFVCYTSNAMRDIIRSEANKRKLVELEHDGEKWVPRVS